MKTVKYHNVPTPAEVMTGIIILGAGVISATASGISTGLNKAISMTMRKSRRWA